MSAKSLMAVSMVALFAGATPAEARFGKRSKPGSSSSSTSSSSQSGEAHEASPVGSTGASPRSAPSDVVAPSYLAPRWRHRHHRFGWFGGGYVPVYVVPSASPQVEARKEQPAPELRATAGVEAMAFTGGASVGVGFGFEGERAGFNAALNHLSVRSDDGSNGLDTIKQLNLHLTYALLAGNLGRLRLEAGADSAFAPELIVVGPSVGASGVLWVVGPLALEASASVTPFPFRQVDCRAGVGLGLGALGVRAGWRSLLLDDAGLVDGVAHQDLFSGPYAGLTLVF